MPHTPIRIHINRRTFEAERSPMTGLEILGLANYGPDYELYRLQGEGDKTGGTLVQHHENVSLSPGLHFRAIPGNANFGALDR